RSYLLDQVVPERRQAGPPEHHALRYLRLARALGADASGDAVAASAPRACPAGDGKQVLGLCAGARYGSAKRWPLEKFGAVAKKVGAATGAQWMLLGSADEVAEGEELHRLLEGRSTNLVGLTTLEQLIERLRECTLLLTNDTGTMHLADFLGIPVVAIFGSTEPTLTGPLGAGHRVIRHHVECSPCFLRTCPIDFRCMEEVTVDEVAGAVLEVARVR
ncbi:MAG: glycosyltransferase family 9 protein, partial [Verrucomicrobiales bacterium]